MGADHAGDHVHEEIASGQIYSRIKDIIHSILETDPSLERSSFIKYKQSKLSFDL